MKTEYRVDDYYIVSYSDIVDNNQLTESELNEFDSLKIGETCYLGIIHVKRII